MNKKAILLLSGGLDSILAGRIMLEQGIEIEAVHFTMVFSDSENGAANVAKELGIRFTAKNITQEFLEVVKSPKHGYGSGVNPCVDCKIFMFKKAKEYMQNSGASFLATGEVLGERPMSQRRDTLSIIERESGTKGLLLRPLSARLLDPTIPEQDGTVDREKLYAISGRSRKPQMELAAKFGIKKYPNPAGGCLLTDPAFSKRADDLLEHNAFTLDNVTLLKLGRHFRWSENCKVIVGRDEKENNAIFALAKDMDLLMNAKNLLGPVALLRGAATADDVNLALRITARYVDRNGKDTVEMQYWTPENESKSFAAVKPLEEEELNKKRI
ncbi:MAG: tRNA 4-thiouridine(8) synthase ThiI [Candidatus Omnitrophica bacterium]|nr:tRNA 4-thiouridine(8) synthase ThiI [Candidatus Omnitrophota bacterium]